jgi:hypothetical protein
MNSKLPIVIAAICLSIMATNISVNSASVRNTFDSSSSTFEVWSIGGMEGMEEWATEEWATVGQGQ